MCLIHGLINKENKVAKFNEFDKLKIQIKNELYTNPRKIKKGKSLGLSFYTDQANDSQTIMTSALKEYLIL